MKQSKSSSGSPKFEIPRISVENGGMGAAAVAEAEKGKSPITSPRGRSTSPLSFLTTLSPKNKSKSKGLKKDFEGLSLGGSERLSPIPFSVTMTTGPTHINQLPHRMLIKILGFIIEEKFDTAKLEIKKSNLPIVQSKSDRDVGSGGGPLRRSKEAQLSEDEIMSKNNNMELECLSMVCKMWGLDVVPQCFTYFIVKSPKSMKTLIRLMTQGLLPGGRKFQFLYVSMIIEKSSNYQKFMNIIKHRMPDSLPEKFFKGTTKPILSNFFSNSLLGMFFESCKSVQYLRFYQRWISPDNFAIIGQSLASNNSIRHLSFRNNNLEDGFIQDLIASLSTNESMTYLDLSGNKLGYETAVGLANALLKNKTLETIDLFYNNINSSGGVALAKSLRYNRTLKHLYLRWNRIKTLGALAMAESLKVNNSIESIYMDRIEDDGGEALFLSLFQNKKVTTLNLSDCAFQEKSLVSLSKVLGSPNSANVITDLNLKSNQLGYGILKNLSDSLSRNKSITKLNLSDNRISDENGFYLAHALFQNRSITTLSLSLNGLSTKFSESLAWSLNTNDTLLFLDISANQITLEGGKLIAKSILTNSHLRLLNLNQNALTSDFGQVIAESLGKNTTLEHLELAYTGLGNKGALPIARVLSNDATKLRKLNLSENSINDQVGTEFSQALESNHELTDLDLSLNNLSLRTKESFEGSMRSNQSLTNYSISSIPLKWKFN